MNNQEIFDKVATHLLKQNAKSIDPALSSNEKQTCAYRGQNGMMCAVGCLIPDDRYSRNMEGKVVWASVIMNVLRDVHGEMQSGLLEALQSCHDSKDVDAWRGELGMIAHNYNLNKAVLAP